RDAHDPTIASASEEVRPVAQAIARTGWVEPSSTTTQPSYSVSLYGAFIGTVAVPSLVGTKLPQSAIAFPCRVSQSSYGRPLFDGGRPLTVSFIGQLPAESTSKRASDAWAFSASGVPVIVTVWTALGVAW